MPGFYVATAAATCQPLPKGLSDAYRRPNTLITPASSKGGFPCETLPETSPPCPLPCSLRPEPFRLHPGIPRDAPTIRSAPASTCPSAELRTAKRQTAREEDPTNSKIKSLALLLLFALFSACHGHGLAPNPRTTPETSLPPEDQPTYHVSSSSCIILPPGHPHQPITSSPFPTCIPIPSGMVYVIDDWGYGDVDAGIGLRVWEAIDTLQKAADCGILLSRGLIWRRHKSEGLSEGSKPCGAVLRVAGRRIPKVDSSARKAAFHFPGLSPPRRLLSARRIF
jgi:hypothetical protein